MGLAKHRKHHVACMCTDPLRQAPLSTFSNTIRDYPRPQAQVQASAPHPSTPARSALMHNLGGLTVEGPAYMPSVLRHNSLSCDLLECLTPYSTPRHCAPMGTIQPQLLPHHRRGTNLKQRQARARAAVPLLSCVQTADKVAISSRNL